jgi:hypothetical protein
MWYDFMESATNGLVCNGFPCMVGCKSYWNSQYAMETILNSSKTCRTNLGHAYMNTDDSKKAGYSLLPTSNQQCLFVVDSKCYPISYSRQTRGSGGFLNTQNSIHVAYFDLVPFRCTVSGGGGFYANGNACPAASGLTCCLMYVKQDIFFNT